MKLKTLFFTLILFIATSCAPNDILKHESQEQKEEQKEENKNFNINDWNNHEDSTVINLSPDPKTILL